MNKNLMMKMDMSSFDYFYHLRKVNIEHFFADLLPKYGKPLRKSQLEMAIEVEDAFLNNKKFIAEAEVGTGKTFAYIVPAYNLYNKSNSILLEKKPILISTATIILQEQLIEKDLKFIRDVLVKENYSTNSHFDYCLLKGKENFICEERLQKVINSNRVTDIIDEVAELYERKGHFDRNDFPFVDDNIWEKISVKRCSNKCQYRECRFKEYKNRSRNSEHMFYVCNHHYLLSCLKDSNFKIEQYSAVIIDEAHNLENAAFSIFGDNKNIHSFRSVIEKIRRKISNSIYVKRASLNRVNKIEDMVKELFGILETSTIVPSSKVEIDWRYELNYSDIIANKVISLKSEISDLYNNDISYIDQFSVTRYGKAKEDDDLENEISNLISFLEAIANKQSNIFWVQFNRFKNNNLFNLYYIPKNIDKILYEKLINKDIPILFTSATLSDTSADEYGFDYFEDCVGLVELPNSKNQAPISKKSSFNYKENCALYIEKKLKHVKVEDDEYNKYLINKAERIFDIISTIGGKSLVLFTSYEVLNFTVDIIRERVKELLGINCYVQGERNVKELYIKFKNDINSCLFATGSFWEGIDVPGKSLSCVIIDKLPFSVIDPIIKLKKEKSQKSDIMEILLPEMVIKLRQGAGRLIRDVNDRGVIAILDSRAYDNYYNVVKSSLPECVEIKNIHEFDKFISVKEKAV